MRAALPTLLAAALCGCASAPAPPAPPAVAARPDGTYADAAPPALPAGLPADARAIALAGPAGGPRLFAVTRVHAGEHVDFLGIGAAGVTRQDGDWRLFGRGDPAFGSALVAGADGWTYAFGVRGDGGRPRAYLARFPRGRLAHRAAWEFLGPGGAFVPAVRDAVPLFDSGPGGVAVVAPPAVRGLLALSLRAAPGGGSHLVGRASATRVPPFGPWSAERIVAELPALAAAGRVPFDRVLRAVPDEPDVVLIPGAGRFRLVPSAQRP